MDGSNPPIAAHENIYSALASAQAEFGAVVKGAVNPAFRSRYADLADVVSVVVPALNRHGVAVLHYLAGGDLDRMRTEFVHAASGTKVWCDVRLIVAKNDMQGMKSATTYAKRIGLESLSCVAPEDDDGNDAAKAAPKVAEGNSRQQQPSAQQPPADARQITEDEYRTIRAKAQEAGIEEAKIAATYGIRQLPEMTVAQFNSAMRKLDTTIEARKSAAADLNGDEIPY